ncbi:DNA polymerase III subunit beta [Ancylobacter dichloromethanicus]|uniref:Beta sliding clamp n=1 Tax=Ancylobacter dichloromethanicus TaxID=518825 RepID=A0A9W6MYH7_9HYPH|nr:DNA polymerase III subunit beta [Ancylobacter dichloromethanicus]MBS7554549.1 DNA polymerase III subunit beta [Ancylobacter dichloromethanicus]GLK71679.1 DNA polymerase III subunit beta [Ancylobacter dichloromethanicus]
MNITLERAAFLAALQRARHAVERRNTVPILANVLLRASAGRLTLIATDLDIEIEDSLPAECAAEGETTLPAQTLLDIVKKLPEGTQIKLEVSADKGTAVLRAGRSRFALQTLLPSDFPSLARVEDGVAFDLPGHALADAIERVKFAISTEETRYYLNGIYLHRDPQVADRLRLVATDGHRLSLASLTVEGLPDFPGVIVPRKAVEELSRMAQAADKAPLALRVSQVKLAATLGKACFTTKLIDGTFPDYGRVIPSGNDKVATLQAEELNAAVDRVGTVAAERGRAVKCTFGEGRLVLEVTNPDAGSAYEEIEIAYAAEEISIGFNGKYVMDVLAATAKTGPIEIALHDPGSPTILRRPDMTDALCVLMPMRVS